MRPSRGDWVGMENCVWRPQSSPGRPEPDRPPRAPGRIPWAELFRRVFRIDVLQCERCGGEMKVLALVTEQAAIKKILEHLDLPSTGPPIAKARRLPEFDFVA